MGKQGNYPSSKKHLTWKTPKTRILNESKKQEVLIPHPFKSKPIKAAYTPSTLSESSPFSNPPHISLLPVDKLIRHEEFLRQGTKSVSFSKNDILSWNDAPMVGTKDKNGNIIILDGSTRLTRIEILSEYIVEHPHPPVFPVQIIDYSHKDLMLHIWEDHHSPEKKLTKQEVLEMVENGKFVEAKQTRFGVRIEKNVYSIAETQGELFIPIEELIGFTPDPNNNIMMYLLA